MAGATARRSSMASSPATSSQDRRGTSADLADSQTCFRETIRGSSFLPLGVARRGKATASARARAEAQSAARLRPAKPWAASRNFAP